MFSAVIALVLGVSFTQAQDERPPSTPVVGYTPGLTMVEGGEPLTTTISLEITSPANLPVGPTVTISPAVAVLGAPEGVSTALALTYVTVTPTSVSFTGPGQTAIVTVEGYFPVGVTAGDYSYKIFTPGWGVEVEDTGAFLNATLYPPPVPKIPPTVSISTPVDNAQFVYEPLVGPLQVPFSFTASAPSASPITAIDADLNGTAVTINSSSNPDGSFTCTGILSITSGGIYTLRARASNRDGTTTDDVTFTVSVVAPPPTAAIITPVANATYTLSPAGTVSVPYSFNGQSLYGGISSLTATLNGDTVNFGALGLGTPVATGNGSFTVTAAGTYEVILTAVDANGTGTARTTFTVHAPIPVPAPTVTISAPANGDVISRVTGSPATLVPFSFAGNAGAGSAITALSGTLNGAPLSASVTGIGSSTATGTGQLAISAPGTYTLAASATSAGGVAATSITFTVVETPPPTPICTVNWLPPISLGKPFKAGSKVAIKFELDCECEDGIDRDGDGDPDFYPGQRTKSKTYVDKTVVIAVTEILANGSDGSTELFAYGSGYTIQGNDMYHLNFSPARGARRYRVEVFSFGNNLPTPVVYGTREFTTR